MVRSPDLIDAKALEADFFFEHLRNSGTDFFAARCYFSAFISAARSITFAVQAGMKHEPGFTAWYDQARQVLKDDPICRFFVTSRNEALHIGATPVNSGSMGRGTDGSLAIHYYFSSWGKAASQDTPTDDVVTACQHYLRALVELLFDLYSKFEVLSPKSFFSVENLRRRGMPVEDVEAALGFPRGWTQGMSIDERVRALSSASPDTAIDRLFMKYLGKTRPLHTTE